MQYHIQTTPIWDAFSSNCECPICVIYKNCSDKLVAQYLNEAVMEPEYRMKVNKLGFCDYHFNELYRGENKLGLALQVHTRTESVINNLAKITTAKQAKKEADAITKSLSTCVICDQVEDYMSRYAYTIAQMYANEVEFPKLLENCKGFCLPHYALLLEYASKAGAKADQYANALWYLEQKELKRLNKETEWFTLKFDYRNNDKPWRTSKDALYRGINKLRGTILEKSGDK